jgi:hypothetical protein
MISVFNVGKVQAVIGAERMGRWAAIRLCSAAPV